MNYLTMMSMMIQEGDTDEHVDNNHFQHQGTKYDSLTSEIRTRIIENYI